LTSSSLNGLMIASTFFITLPPYVVKPWDGSAVSVAAPITVHMTFIRLSILCDFLAFHLNP
ncbi:MAG: hypothetical protein OER74_09440, partial [Desulfobacteraceae bacterium]|nr:hypothetical protein [Desulfobacteraceae bacterium]